MSKFYFQKAFVAWTLADSDSLLLEHIESEGSNLEEMLENAVLTFCTQWGGDGPRWSVGELSTRDYNQVMKLFTEFLAEKAAA